MTRTPLARPSAKSDDTLHCTTLPYVTTDDHRCMAQSPKETL
jgi:hypothetical protein